MRFPVKAGAIAPLFILAALISPLNAQSPQTADVNRPAFDAVSIKRNNSGAVSSRVNLGQRGGHIAIVNFSVRQLMALAFDFPNLSQAHNGIVGGPDWIDSDRFDITAEAEGDPGIEQKSLMLRSMLADRFKLVVHHDTRQLPVYALVPANPGRLGSQLHTHANNEPCEQVGQSANLQQSPSASAAPPRSLAEAATLELRRFPCGRVVGGKLPGDSGQVWAGGRMVTMEMIATSIGGMERFDRHVLDRTRMNGGFDFTVEWDPVVESMSLNPRPDSAGLSLIQALREQVGLKLESQTGPVDVLVIDQVEMPSEN